MLNSLNESLFKDQKLRRIAKTTKTTFALLVECYYVFFFLSSHKKIYEKDARSEIPLGNTALNEGIKAAEGRLWFFIILHLLFEVEARDSRNSEMSVMPRS